MTFINKTTQNISRSKKPRFYGDIQLADNLYKDNKGREGHWRYRRPDGTYKHFSAPSVEKANAIAEDNNKRRDSMPTASKSKNSTLEIYVPEYIAYREEQSPDLKDKSSWSNRKYHMQQLTREITLPITLIDRAAIQAWWDKLTHHQQKARHAEFRKLFNYLMGRSLLKGLDYNPFTTSDDRPRLYVRSEPKRQSQRLTRKGFWAIYNAAGELGYPALQIAMGVSLTTFMRENDICTLLISDKTEDDLLKKVIGKSLNQKGNAKAARLSWDVRNYELLRQLIQRGRELALANRHCPYLISHWPKQKRLGNVKTHMAQVLPRRLISMFDEARIHAGFSRQNPPVFHGIKSLATKLATDAGYQKKSIQLASSHSSEDVQNIYLEDHELPYNTVDIAFTADQIGGEFK